MVGWYVGAGINLVGSIAINLGTNLMKLGHNKRAMMDMPEEQKPSAAKIREWQIGTLFFIIGNIGNFVSFGFAAQSLLAALGSVQFVSNVFFAALVLKEKANALVLIATACILGGCLLLVLFGNHESKDYTVGQLLDLYGGPAYIVYLTLMGLFVVGAYALYLRGKQMATKHPDQQHFLIKMLPVTYVIFCALIGTQSVLFSKSLSVLLRATFTGDNQLGNWYTWVTLVCFLGTAGFWVTRLNKGLRLFPALVIVPLMQIGWSLFSIVSGMLYFQEYKTFGVLSAVMFVIGVLIVFLGVILLTKAGAKKAEEEKARADKEAAEKELTSVSNPMYDGHGSSGGGGVSVNAGMGAGFGAGGMGPGSLRMSIDEDGRNSCASSVVSLHVGAGGAVPPATPPGRSGFGPRDGQQEPGSGGPGVGLATAGSAKLGGRPGSQRLAIIFDSDEEVEDEEGSEVEMSASVPTGSGMGTMRKHMRKLKHRFKSDFAVDPADLKAIFGVGSTKGVIPISMFAMPGVDFPTAPSAYERMREAQAREAKQRLLGKPSQADGLGNIRSQSVTEMERRSSLDQAAPGGQGAEAAGPGVSRFAGAAGSLPGSFSLGSGNTARSLPFSSEDARDKERADNLLRGIVNKTVKQVEVATSRARATVDAHRAGRYQTLEGDMELGTPPRAQPMGSLERPLSGA